MRAGRRKIKDYTCWLCGKTIKINVPPYQRNSWPMCNCEEEGRIGGGTMPYGLTREQIDKAIEEYDRAEACD